MTNWRDIFPSSQRHLLIEAVSNDDMLSKLVCQMAALLDTVTQTVTPPAPPTIAPPAVPALTVTAIVGDGKGLSYDPLKMRYMVRLQHPHTPYAGYGDVFYVRPPVMFSWLETDTSVSVTYKYVNGSWDWYLTDETLHE